MSELDKFLGPKPTVSMPTACKSHFGRYPDVSVLCDIFAEEMGWKIDDYTRRTIAAGARDYKQAIDNDPKRLLKAIQKMKKAGLSIASPRSCITTARRTKDDVDTQKYLKGVDDSQEPFTGGTTPTYFGEQEKE